MWHRVTVLSFWVKPDRPLWSVLFVSVTNVQAMTGLNFLTAGFSASAHELTIVRHGGM